MNKTNLFVGGSISILILSYSYYFYKKKNKEYLWRNIPILKNKIDNEINKIKKNNDEDTQNYYNKIVEKLDYVINVNNNFNINTIPSIGYNKDLLIKYLYTLKELDPKPKLISGTMYDVDTNKHKEIMNIAYNLYSYTNPMHTDLFNSVVFMEKNLITMISKLLNNEDNQCGSITNGGTESLFLAIKTYRDMINTDPIKINVIASDTVHCSIDKICHYLNINLIKIKSNHEHRITVNDILKKINQYTACVILSAPSYGYGIMDDILNIAPIMMKKRIPVHIDACLGGFIWMFQENRGNYSFNVAGVTSISICLHKYGYSHKGVSCILYKNKNFLKYQYFVSSDWDGGLYVSPTILGSRSGGLVAQAWVGFLSRGFKEYQECSNYIIFLAKYTYEKLKNICYLYPLDLHIVCFSIKEDTYKLYDYLIERGYNLNALQNPPGIHLCITKNHNEKLIDLLVDEIKNFINNKNNIKYNENLAPIYGMKSSIPFYSKNIMNECILSYLVNKYSS
jgi:sphinganine-1-phosphate aldolase